MNKHTLHKSQALFILNTTIALDSFQNRKVTLVSEYRESLFLNYLFV